MPVLDEKTKYVTIKENTSVLIDGKLEHWPPQKVMKIHGITVRTRTRRQYLKMLFRVESPIRSRSRVKLNGRFLESNGSHTPMIVCAWLDDLIFFNVDFKTKRARRVDTEQRNVDKS